MLRIIVSVTSIKLNKNWFTIIKIYKTMKIKILTRNFKFYFFNSYFKKK